MVLGAEWTGNPSAWHPRPDPLMPAFHPASALWEPVLHGAGTSLPQALHPTSLFLLPSVTPVLPYPRYGAAETLPTRKAQFTSDLLHKPSSSSEDAVGCTLHRQP